MVLNWDWSFHIRKSVEIYRAVSLSTREVNCSAVSQPVLKLGELTRFPYDIKLSASKSRAFQLLYYRLNKTSSYLNSSSFLSLLYLIFVVVYGLCKKAQLSPLDHVAYEEYTSAKMLKYQKHQKIVFWPKCCPLCLLALYPIPVPYSIPAPYPIPCPYLIPGLPWASKDLFLKTVKYYYFSHFYRGGYWDLQRFSKLTSQGHRGCRC